MPGGPRFAIKQRNVAVFLLLVCAALVVFTACGEADEDLTPTATTGSGGDTDPTDEPDDGEEIAFPRQEPAVGWNDAALPGVLVEQDGCLWIESEDGTLTLPIWWHEQEYRIEDGVVQLLNADGEVAAEVGDRVMLGGSGSSDWEDAGTLPEACQSGPFWFASPDIINEDQREADAVQPPEEFFTYDPDAQSLPDVETVAARVEFVDGCLTVQPSTSEERFAAVWPAGVHFESDYEELIVTLADERSLRTGPQQGHVVSGIEAVDEDQLRDLVKLETEAAGCDGPYWVIETAGSAPGLQDEEDAIRTDAAMYAVDMGVSLEEAIERLEMQNSGPDGSNEISELNLALERNEADTFGGLWLQHEPEYAIVVAFTENGEETLAPYIEDFENRDLIEVRQVEYTQRELRNAQDEINRILRDAEIDINFASSTLIMENRVELIVPDVEEFEALFEEHGVTLPEPVTIVDGSIDATTSDDGNAED